MRISFTALLIILSNYITAQNKNLQLLGKLGYGNISIANLDGYADTSGNEYALVGTENGLSIVDITNPAAPVQVQLVNGQNSFWREVRHYKHYAYVTNEAGGGLQIVDLSKLPDSIKVKSIFPMGMNTSHTVFIDEKGVAYINGTDVGNGGVIFLNLEPDPWNPTVMGNFDNNYVHDCFARGDTLWAALINDGIIKVVNTSVKNQTNPVAKTLATWSTPNDFAHNCWLDSSGKYLFTTDERENSYLACYDVSNLNNVTETDRIQHKAGSNAIIHNTYWMQDYCISSYYTEGVILHDVSRKHNLVEVGNFDTSPGFSGNQNGGFHGAWGVWPFLPSGNIIASDMEEGLYILKPSFKRACYLEGNVKDSVCGVMLNNVLVEILTTNTKDNTKLNGSFATGIPDSGTYNIRFSRAGYATKTINNVTLSNGVVTNLNIELVPTSTVQLEIEVRDSATGQLVPDAQLKLLLYGSNVPTFVATDSTGKFKACDFVQGNYVVHTGKWGYRTVRDSIAINNNSNYHIFIIAPGYYDDFTFDFKWQVNSTATSGKWIRARPVGTTFQGQVSNPGNDVVGDLNTECYVTGNAGTQAGDADVDDGYTELTSPIFNLSNSNDPIISYYRWFFNNGGDGNPNDSLVVSLNNGSDNKVIELALATDTLQSRWVFRSMRIKDFMTPTANMTITFRTSDYASSGHLVEAGVDVFRVSDTSIALFAKNIETDKNNMQVITNSTGKHIIIHTNSTEEGTIQFIDILGRTIKTVSIKNQDLVTVPNTNEQFILGVLTINGNTSIIKIY